jgi:sulfonate transport system ATP-binding protein
MSANLAKQQTALAVSTNQLVRRFGEHPALNGLDLDIHMGEFVALLGKSGSGKTTLLRLLAGLDTPDSGDLLVPEARTVVFQEPRLVNSKRVWRNVTLGLAHTSATQEAALRALGEVGLGERAYVWPATLSGGEAQRVALARALVREPQLLLLDEPFAALDALTRLQMQKLVGDLCERHGPAVLLVTHDVDEALLLADRVVLLREGRLAVELTIDIPRPREVAGEAFVALRRQLLGELGVELESIVMDF